MEQKCTNIQVAIRIRPFIPSEMKTKLRPQWDTQDNIIYQIDDCGHKFGEVYSFDHIFGIDKTNLQIYTDIVKDFALSSLDGLNATIFAYGQTSSGKTYTMLGNKNDTGIMSLAIDNIFDIVESDATRKFLIRVSYIEIYNEKINDLLDLGNKDVKIREFSSGAIGLQNVKEEMVSSRDQVHHYLKIGNLNRHIGSTKINDRSSRSHTIFRIMIESTKTCDFDGSSGPVQVSNLNLVDLAGSERVAQTKATGVRLKEGGHINKSLSALGLVIKQLSDGQEFVNFRDSKLTRLLQDSLGGNSKTLIIATITLTSIEDTGSTLAFAQRAKTVRNKPQVNTMLTDGDLGKRYAALNTMLNEELLKNQELQRTREDNSREIARLKQQMEMLENFLYGNKNVNLDSQPIPKRRHTIGFSAHKQLFSKISMEEFGKCGDSSDNISLLEDITKESLICASTLEPIAEEDTTPLKELSFEECSRNFTFRQSVSKPSTPEACLRIRLSALEQDYNELLTFTRHEENIFSEASRKVENLEELLETAQKKILELEAKQKLTEHNLCAQINELEQQLTNKEDVIVDCQKLKDLLIYLQEVLSSSNFTNEIEAEEENSVLSIIERFNVKVKTSKDIIENEILKQISIFEHDLSKQINLTNELASFNHLLNELSLFESDLPVDLINNMKQDTVKDFKTLIQIYESLLTKNALIQKCSEKIKMLEDGNKIQSESFNKEINSMKIHESTLQKQLQEKIDAILYFQKERQDLNREKENLVVEVEEAKRVIKEHISTINDYKSKIVSMENVCVQLSHENGQLKQKLTNVFSENMDLTNCVTKLNVGIAEKNKEIEQIIKESSNNLLENHSLKSDIKTLNSELKHTQSNIEQLSLEIREKDNAISDSKFENNLLKTRVESLNKNLQNILFENEQLKEQMTVLKDCNASYVEKINLLQDEVGKLVAKIELSASDMIKIVDPKDDLGDKQTKLSLQSETDIVTAEIFKNAKIIDANKCLTQEVNSLNQQIRKILLENENLKQQIQDMTDSECLQNDKITSLQGQISKLTKEITLKNESLLECKNVNCVLKQDIVVSKNQFSSILSENELLKHEIVDLKKKFEKTSFELSEKNKTLCRIKDSETDTNKLKCKVKQFESELLSCNKKINEYAQLIQSLHAAKNELENRIKQDYYKNDSQEEKYQALVVRISELNSVKKNLQSVVCSIIEEIINEQKSLLTMRLSQEQREEFKIILKELKCNISILKQQLNFLQNSREYDYNEIKDSLVKAQCSLKEYFSTDKFFMQKQINILESTNKEYLQEIMVLKDLQQPNNDCRYCDTLKAELLGLKKQKISQDEILNSLKNQNKLLGKENRSRMEQVVNLQMQIYNEQDKKVEPKHSELLTLYDENKKMQQREIQMLQQRIEKMKNLPSKNRTSIQIQCSLLKEETPMLLKDKLTNDIYLPKTISEIKLEEHQTHANINKPNVDVQCNIIDWEKYNLTKKLCQLRKTEIESMKLEVEKLKSCTTKDKVVYKPAGVQCNIIDWEKRKN